MAGSWKAAAIAGVAGGLLLLMLGVAGGVKFHDQISGLFAANHAPVTPAAATENAGPHDKPRKILYWQDAMYNPPYISDKPGKSPMGMDLTPVYEDELAAGPEVKVDPAVVQNMGVRVAQASIGTLRRTIRAVGTFVEPDQNHVEVNLRVSGWIEKLYANQENMPVAKGAPLFDLYSPEITAAADELITARRGTSGTGGEEVAMMLAAARRKLSLMGLDKEQIDAIAKMDQAPKTVTFVSPMTGHITEKMVVEGAAVKAGERVMRIADLSTMWLLVQVYERDLELVNPGTKVEATVAAFPGETFSGTVDFIYPHLDMMNRTARVRVILPNPGHRLREGMYATAMLSATVGRGAVLVPREAVIDSGNRQVVLVAEEGGHFSPRKVTIGGSGYAGDDGDGPEMVCVLSGLSAAESVVTSGQFLLDSESRREDAIEKMRTRGSAGGRPVAQGGDTR